MSEDSIRFTCPRCGAEHLVSPQSVGHKMRCPQCSRVVRVLLEATRPTTARAVENSSSNPSSPPPRWANPTPPPVVVPPPPEPQPTSALDEAAMPGLKKRPKRGFVESEMDMTPMVDVVFQLLIFFMLTAAFTIQKSQPHPKPNVDEPTSAPTKPDEDPDYIIVRIDSQNTYYVSGGGAPDEEEAPSPQELAIKLSALRQGAAGAVPTKLLVKAHGDALHERVVTAIDLGNDVGIEEVKVLTVEDED